MTPAFAQQPASGQVKELTLQESLQYALDNNQDMKKASDDEQIANQLIRETKSVGLPQVTASGGLDYFPALPTQILPGELAGQPGTDIPVQFGKDYNVKGNVQITQLLFNQSYFVGLQAVVDIILAIEKKFNITVPDEVPVYSVDDFVNYIYGQRVAAS